jgi:hypothetical protein
MHLLEIPLIAVIWAYGFWGVVGSIILLTSFFVICAYDKGIISTIIVVLLAVIAASLTPYNAFRYIYVHPVKSLLFAAAYFAIGAVWSVFKWGRVAQLARERFDYFFKNYVKSALAHANAYLQGDGNEGHDYMMTEYFGGHRFDVEGVKRIITALVQNKIPDELLSHWHKVSIGHNLPAINKYKHAIYTWISLWPFSAASYLLKDVLRDIAEYIFNRLRSVYHMVVMRQFKNVDSRLLAKP